MLSLAIQAVAAFEASEVESGMSPGLHSALATTVEMAEADIDMEPAVPVSVDF